MGENNEHIGLERMKKKKKEKSEYDVNKDYPLELGLDRRSEKTLTESQKELKILTNQLYWCFRGAYTERFDLRKLYEKGSKIREKVEKLKPKFWEKDNCKDLQDALGFLDELHDPETERYNRYNKEIVYYHMKRLHNQ